MNIWRLAVRGASEARGVLLLLAMLSFVGAGLLFGVPRAIDAGATNALQSELSTVGAGSLALDSAISDTALSSTGVREVQPVWTGVGDRLASIRSRLDRTVVGPGDYVGQAFGRGQKGVVGSGTSTSASNAKYFFTVEAAPRLSAYATLSSGHWPRATQPGNPIQVVIATPSSASLRWQVGQVQTLEGNPPQLALLVGTVNPRSRDAAFWSLDPHRANVGAQPSADGTFVSYYATIWVNSTSWPTLASAFDSRLVAVWFPIKTHSIEAGRIAQIASDIRRFTVNPLPIGIQGTDGQFSFYTNLPMRLAAFQERAGPSESLTILFLIGPAGSFLAVVVLGLLFLRQRRSSSEALLASRGASMWQIRAVAAIELGVWTGPAGIIGCLLAVGATSGWKSVPDAVSAACLYGFSFALLAGALVVGQFRQAVPSRGRALRVSFESVLFVLAVLTIYIIERRGPAGDSSLDPLLIALPLTVGLALSTFILRVVPLTSKASAWVSNRTNAPIGLLVRSRRRVRKYRIGWTLFAMVIGVGMAVFSVTMVDTQRAGAMQAALSQVGADVSVQGTSLTPGQVRGLTSLPGVEDQAVIRVIGQQAVGGSRVTIYSVDAHDLARVQGGISNSLLSGVSGTRAIAGGFSDSVPHSVQVGGQSFTLSTVDSNGVSRVLTDPTWILVDSSRLSVSARGDIATAVLFRFASDYEAKQFAAAARQLLGKGAVVLSAAAVYSNFVGTGLDANVHSALTVAIGLSGLLVLTAFVLQVAATAPERLRRAAILRALGFSARQIDSASLADLIPTALAGSLVGTLCGILVATVSLRTIDPIGLTGSTVVPPLVVSAFALLFPTVGFGLIAVLSSASVIVAERRRSRSVELKILSEER